MLFSKTFFSSVVVLSISLRTYAHAGVTPALGVTGNFARRDVQRPSAARPCGKINIAQNLDTSTPVPVAADGTFTVTATNFNAGRDGSRQFTATVDPTAAGKNLQPVTISQNGQLAPQTTGSEQIVAQLPPGTTCTGGQAGNLCLASFESAGKFGNCVVLQQGAAAAGAGAGNATAGSATGAAAGSGGGSATGATTGSVAGAANDASAGTTAGASTNAGTTRTKTNGRQKVVGTRAPRALLKALRSVEERGEEVANIAKRGIIERIKALLNKL